jgi:hypothetical protein
MRVHRPAMSSEATAATRPVHDKRRSKSRQQPVISRPASVSVYGAPTTDSHQVSLSPCCWPFPGLFYHFHTLPTHSISSRARPLCSWSGSCCWPFHSTARYGQEGPFKQKSSSHCIQLDSLTFVTIDRVASRERPSSDCSTPTWQWHLGGQIYLSID